VSSQPVSHRQDLIQPTLPTEDQPVVPPFISATTFPANPKPEKLADLYPKCLQALKEANQARDIHKKCLSAKKSIVADISAAISQYEQDLALEAATRAQLHSVNEKLIETLRDMEKIAGDITETVIEAHRVKRFDLWQLVMQLRTQAKAWRTTKLRQLKALANKRLSGRDG
jgi:hypothetical protein